MSMLDELYSYIAGLQRRLWLRASLRGIAALAVTALTVTVAAVLLLDRYAFPVRGVSWVRVALAVVLLVVAVIALAWPLARLTRGRAVRDIESAHPELEQRLTTIYQRGGGGDPFLELLAADTLSRTRVAPASSLASTNLLLSLAALGIGCLGLLTWLIVAGPGSLGYGASLVWTGPKKSVAPLYAIAVTPGDVAVRRHSDQLVTAQVKGMRPDKVQLFAHFQSAAGWEPVAMQMEPDAGGAAAYQFVLTGLPENVEYYVAAGPLASPHYTVRVVDLPSVKSMRVTYRYPAWTGLKSLTDEHSGDLRAIEGTDAAIEVEMDRPLKDGQLLLDGGRGIHLSGGEGNRYQGTIHMAKDGTYHVAATDGGQPVRLSEDFFIATDKAAPPEIAIDHPGRDYRASPIEEVTVGVKGSAQFGLRDMHLHYSVNGGPDREVNLLKAAGSKDADGSYTLRLEDFKLIPGDLVSLYATAKDGHAEARTDISFIQADPFEREFSQSQQGGGGGGGGGGQQNNQTEISKREKELIAATWKQQNDKNATAKDAAVQGQFLADAQQKLRDQVMALSARMQSRDLAGANEEFTGFEKDMQVAAAAMAPSADKLKETQWAGALPLEQKALQALLRAEATFRQIQVAFGQQGGGGGGSGDSAGRDLASLFDLELDTEKNQYETAQTASPEEQRAKDVNDALEKLDALAKRQEELAQQQAKPQQSFEQRWQQEMLRREAEQLQRQMQQLAQNGGQQGGQGQKSSSGGSQASSSGSQGEGASGRSTGGQQAKASGQAGDSSGKQGSDPRIQQALDRLQQAGEAMKRNGGQSGDGARQAAERLRDASSLLAGTQKQMATGKVDSLSREADRLTQQEREQAGQIQSLVKEQSESGATDAASMTARLKERNRLAGERQELSNSLSKLQKDVRDAARGMASEQPGVAQKLRDALTEMDQTDLDNHVQRTADWLRRGINPNASGTEGQIAQGLQKLGEQLRAAQGQMGRGGADKRGASGPGDQSAALGQVARLRSQIESMTSARGREQGGSGGKDGKQGNGTQMAQGGRQGQASGSGGNQPGQGGQQGGGQQAGNGQQGGKGQQGGQGQQAGGGPGQGSQQAGGRSGGQGGGQTGDSGGPNGEIRRGGGGAGGVAWGNVNTGNNQYGQPGQRPVAGDTSGNPADTERTYQQGMRELNQLRGMVQGNAQAEKELQDLTRRMQQLDPKRFPGNPAMVEEMHREVLSAVDRLELQLQRDGASVARTGKPFVVPQGYQDSVAEYYRRLSAKP